MIKPSIPGTSNLPQNIAQVIEPLKINVELITGSRPGSIELPDLSTSASLAEVITKVNQILSRINQNG